MSFPLLPESAPFSAPQRAWLNGFFAGIFTPDATSENALISNGATPETVATEEDFPWHDAAIPLHERLQMAQGKPFPRVLMAAMAQLDCGSCGYLCQSYAEAIASGADKDLTKCSPGGRETKNKLKELVANAPIQAEIALSADPLPKPSGSTRQLQGKPLFDRLNPFPAPVLEVRPLTRKDSQKDVRFVSFGLNGSGLQYAAGDALGVFPENCEELVEAILQELDATGHEPTLSPENTVIPSRMALFKGYVINQVSDDFLTRLSEIAARDDERARLQQLAQSDDGYLEGRDVLDVLHAFPSARPRESGQIGSLIAALSPLRPRLYSISSSPLAHPGEVHLTVGVVRYNRNGSPRLRKGVASTFLSERVMKNQRVGVFVQTSHGFRPPVNGDAPMIMVGPGTGIAPFRAFLEERRERGHRGKNWLFFGDQKRETDFLFQNEIEEYVRNGHLKRLDLAFSRDQLEKVYVQHKMIENGAELWRWLDEGGHFYVCGDASRMAKDVDKALHQVVETHGSMSADNARQYVAEMSQTGRYGRDVY